MGTCIKLQVERGENLSLAEWNEFKDDFQAEHEEIDSECESFISCTVYCSYSSAYLENQTQAFKDKWINKDISFSLWYEERDPDETLSFGEEV